MKEITVTEIEQRFLNGEKLSIIDVREHEELVIHGKIPNSIHIPLHELPNRLDEIDQNEQHFLLCQSGGRSAIACSFLLEHGYKAINIIDGIVNWTGKFEQK